MGAEPSYLKRAERYTSGTTLGTVASSSVAASGQLVVEAIEKTTDGMIVVIKGSGKAASATVKLSGKAVKGLSIAVGEAVELTALSTGYMLYYSGKAIAFIPTEAGKALIENAKAK